MMATSEGWQEVRNRLEAKRAAINAEIAAYPAPIPACDAQYNHLLEERAHLAAELARLEAAVRKGADAAAVSAFVEACPFLAGGGE